MGVSQYYLRYIRRYLAGRVRGLVVPRLEVVVDSLHLDANALVHAARTKLFEYAEQASAEERQRVYLNRSLPREQQVELLAQQTWALISDLSVTVRPRQLLTIMFDGVVPVAKMKQQRARRFHHQDQGAQSVPGLDLPAAISPNDISVSTDLMEYLHLYIEDQLSRLMHNCDPNFPPTIIYSSHHRPGEGEHKILEAFRKGDVPLTETGYHVLWGLDNDLFQLGLLLPTDRVILGRDDGQVEYVFLDVLKDYLRQAMVPMEPSPSGNVRTARRPPPGFDDPNEVAREYVALMTLVGNDFLPRAVGVNSLDIDVPELIDAYRRLRTNDPGARLIAEGVGPERHPRWRLGVVNRPAWVALLRLLLDHQWSQIDFQRKHKDDSEFWSKARPLNLTTERGRREFTRRYYAREYKFMTGQDPPRARDGEQPDGPDPIQELKRGMSYYYVQGINWVINYYTVGAHHVNHSYYYPYYSAPMFEDLIEFLGEGFVDDHRWSHEHGSHRIYNALDQLLMTAPSQSSMLSWWPRRLRELYPDLQALAPAVFQTTSDTGSFEWYHQPILPLLDPEGVHEKTQFSEEPGATLEGEPLPPQFRQFTRDTKVVRQFKPPELPRERTVIQATRGGPGARPRRHRDRGTIVLEALTRGVQRSRRGTVVQRKDQ